MPWIDAVRVMGSLIMADVFHKTLDRNASRVDIDDNGVLELD